MSSPDSASNSMAPDSYYFILKSPEAIKVIRKLPNGVTSMRGIGSISIQDRNYTPILITALPPS